ncbi:hypothetical protein AAVH_21008 [Aphelenchoides avenae]|nr:hypothetical protein AAVH_21008 [Aphelenchus avenae]
MCQRVLHAVIAHNRYAAISATSFSSEMAGKRQTRLILIASAVLPLATIGHMFVDRVEYVESTLPPILKLSHSAPWAGTATMATSTALTSMTLVVCVYFDVRTVLGYKALSEHRRKAHRNDFCLFGMG